MLRLLHLWDRAPQSRLHSAFHNDLLARRECVEKLDGLRGSRGADELHGPPYGVLSPRTGGWLTYESGDAR